MQTLNIGLEENQRQGAVKTLNKCLADIYLLVVKTKKYHWDVVGPQFRTLHELWEEQYETLTENIDAVAERIRALGGYPIGTLQEFLNETSLQEKPGNLPSAKAMVESLMQDHEQIVRNLRVAIDRCQSDFKDEGTADMLTGMMVEHTDMAWMLRSFISGEAL